MRNNNTVIHLDLSNNHFTYADCLLISDAISINKSIYGFHFYGNYGFVDNKGFLIIEDKFKQDQIAIPRRIHGMISN